MSKPFHFKKFAIHQDRTAMKVGTDGVLLGAWASILEAERILDIGTGTGVIALMAAQRNAMAQIDAVEIDEASAVQAKENFVASIFKDRLKAYNLSVQTYAAECTQKYDAIISNPPFFEVGNTKEAVDSRRQVGRQTASLSFEALIDAVVSLLSDKGCFYLVLPTPEGKIFIELAEKQDLFCVKRTEVKSIGHKPVERLLLGFSKVKEEGTHGSLLIQKSGVRHDYTDEYVALVKEFYTIL